MPPAYTLLCAALFDQTCVRLRPRRARVQVMSLRKIVETGMADRVCT